MGGEVLELMRERAERLEREAREQGIEQGIERGIREGTGQAIAKLNSAGLSEAAALLTAELSSGK